jgi:hypothetical protein
VTTYPIVSQDLVCFTDRLPPAVVQPAPTDIKALLEGPETSTFEIKGSAFTPLDPWLVEGKMPSESDGFCVDTIAKEVVAFLNTGGGSLVVGALETKRHGEIGALEEFSRNKSNIICGILDQTYAARGWDVWERKLRDILRDHIEPSPINAVEIRPAMHGSTQLGLVAIDAVEPDYYLLSRTEPKSYYIREGTSARRLEGPALERHRKRQRETVRRQRRREEG